MQTTAVRPTGVERTFGADEIIVSKTDPKGRLTYANHVFCRSLRATPSPMLLGQPHNIIRHPDMPGGVFKLAWETIAGGSEIFAYVLNLASDGAHYWVLAHVTPSSRRLRQDRRLPLQPAPARPGRDPGGRAALPRDPGRGAAARARPPLGHRGHGAADADPGRPRRDLRAVGLGHHEQVHDMIATRITPPVPRPGADAPQALVAEWLRVVKAASEGDFEARVMQPCRAPSTCPTPWSSATRSTCSWTGPTPTCASPPRPWTPPARALLAALSCSPAWPARSGWVPNTINEAITAMAASPSTLTRRRPEARWSSPTSSSRPCSTSPSSSPPRPRSSARPRRALPSPPGSPSPTPTPPTARPQASRPPRPRSSTWSS